MSFKAFIKNLFAFLKDLFGDKKTTTVQTVTVDNYTYMPDDVKSYILAGHTPEEKKDILAEIAENEAKKNKSYTINFEDGYYRIVDGQIKNCVKGIPTEDGKMPASVKFFILAGHEGEDRDSIIEQINEAEAAGKTEYRISHARGYYNIKDGQLIGSAAGTKN